MVKPSIGCLSMQCLIRDLLAVLIGPVEEDQHAEAVSNSIRSLVCLKAPGTTMGSVQPGLF